MKKENYWDKKPKPFIGESTSEFVKRYRLWDYYRRLKRKKRF